MTKFDLIKKELHKLFPNSPAKEDPIHSELVLKWVLELKPDADEALRIAAISHDIDRAVWKISDQDRKQNEDYKEFKKKHSIRSANFICELLKKYEYPSEIIEKVRYLVENHEFGGNEEADILMSADSLAYFEYNIPGYLKRNGQERTKEKIKFMFNRMSEKAKTLMKKTKFEDKNIENLVKESVR